METRQLGGTDIAITPVGLGCMQFSGVSGQRLGRRMYPAVTQQVADEVVATALDGGIGWFDTAEMYGRGASERALAAALTARRVPPGRVAIATKWFPLGRTARGIPGTIDDRVGALRPYPIDLYQIHTPYGGLAGHPAQLAAMARLADAGTIRTVGVSNFSARQLVAAHRTLAAQGIPLASNQVHISLLHRTVERNGVLAAARELGVTLIAYTPLESGLLTGRYHGAAAERAAAWRRFGFGVTNRRVARAAPVVEALGAIAGEHGATPAQVALNWLTTFYGDTVVAIPGASTPRQAAEAAAALDFRLDRAELDRLDQLARDHAGR